MVTAVVVVKPLLESLISKLLIGVGQSDPHLAQVLLLFWRPTRPVVVGVALWLIIIVSEFHGSVPVGMAQVEPVGSYL